LHLLEAFPDHPLLEHSRERTQLDDTEAGLGTLLIGEQMLPLLREKRLLPRGDLLDLFELERQEEEVRGRAADLESLDRLAKEGDAKKAAEAREDVEHAAEVAAARLRQKAQNMAQRLAEMPVRARAALPAAASGLARRLVEGRLLSYSLRGVDERGRGPMIVCLDGSGSMAGDKVIWSKAVALTLLEIARRQRRLFRFICFSSADTPLFTLDLNPRE